MKRGDMTDGIFLMHIVDALKETVEFTKDATLELWSGAKEFAPATIALIEALPEYKLAREEDARL